MKDYEAFLAEKIRNDDPSGFDHGDSPLTRGGDLSLFPFQSAIVKWALRRGRAAIFADTGLGKTFMQAAWSWCVHQHTGNRVLILAPLCVAPQTVAEADRLGIPIKYVRSMPLDEHGNPETGILITNYEMLEHFEPWIEQGYFDGVVLDESSILKSQNSKTRARLVRVCSEIPYRLSCTATPAPNDFMELAQQAEFLGVMTAAEMLAMFFIRNTGVETEDDSKWRLKGHAKTRFWEWMSHWATFVKKPSDLGFSDEGYDLPPLEIEEIVVKTGKPVAKTLSERLAARRESLDERVAAGIRRANEIGGPCVIWCNLNDESAKLAAGIAGAIEVKGADRPEEKEERLLGFAAGKYQKIVSKPSIAGFGLNWQHCSEMIFVGLNDSYEQLYQAIRRCYRFGQKRPVRVTLITADSEGAVRENVKRKERQAAEMSDQMVAHMRDFCRREISSTERERGEYRRESFTGDDFTIHLGDCVDVARDMADGSVDFSVFSPPFASLFTYSNLDRDMGNSKSHAIFWEHFQFLVKELLRITRSGRLVSVHVSNLIATKGYDGYIGIRDFRGGVIRLFEECGFHFVSELTVDKDPVVAMQRTKSIRLLWKQIKKDSALSGQALPDYVVTFRKPGENTKPICHTPEEFPVSLWQELAWPCWTDIWQSNTLNRKLAREESDERHICPLQLDLIERLIFLWSSPGDTVFSPFTGIGSEGYVALAMGRKFVGAELKKSYFEIAKQNLKESPRAGYRFPRFSEKVGDWAPGGETTAAVEDLPAEICDEDDKQIDWLREGALSIGGPA